MEKKGIGVLKQRVIVHVNVLCISYPRNVESAFIMYFCGLCTAGSINCHVQDLGTGRHSFSHLSHSGL